MRIVKLSQYLRWVVMSVSVFAAFQANAETTCESNTITKQITEQRQLFNLAIKHADIKTIESILAKDVVLVTGSDSTVFAGKQKQVDLWLQDFNADNERLIYTRNPTCTSLSANNSLAMESGHWRGEDSSGKGFYGYYSAKWRLVAELKQWQLEAEIFMTVGKLK